MVEDEIIFDPNADIINDINEMSSKVHIRIKQRNGRQSSTTIEMLPQNLDFNKILKEMKKSFHCNGGIQNSDSGKIVQLFGDQRNIAKKFLIDNNIIVEQNIIVHGY